MVTVIVACEVGFWVLLGAGLTARYILGARLLSTLLLLAVPLVDVVLLAVSILDLRRGGAADAAHGLAAVYIGVSVAFGHRLVTWADTRFAHRFAGGPPPDRPPRSGRDHAAYERRRWLRHLAAYVTAVAVLAAFTALVGDAARTAPLWQPMAPWAVVLLIDLLVAFSYTVAPRRPPASGTDIA